MAEKLNHELIDGVMRGKPIDLLAQLPADTIATKRAAHHLDEATKYMHEAYEKVEATEARRQD